MSKIGKVDVTIEVTTSSRQLGSTNLGDSTRRMNNRSLQRIWRKKSDEEEEENDVSDSKVTFAFVSNALAS